MAGFGILQECTVTGRKHWVQHHASGVSFTAAGDNDESARSLTYADRAKAEADMAAVKAEHERSVENTKRRRKFKTLPATFSIVEFK